MTPQQVKRLFELPRLIAREADPDNLKRLVTELQEFEAVELEEMRSRFVRPCPTCGVEVGVHTAEKLEECAQKQHEE